MIGSCEHGVKPSSSINGNEFVDQLDDLSDKGCGNLFEILLELKCRFR
jgi:hypothetical protein